MLINLDTHIVISMVVDDLSRAERRLLDGNELGFSAIVFWELHVLANEGRIVLDMSDPDVNRYLNSFRVFPITFNVCRQLRVLDFRSDPADELIAATSVALNVPLLTRDERILRSKVVPFAIS